MNLPEIIHQLNSLSDEKIQELNEWVDQNNGFTNAQFEAKVEEKVNA